MSWSTSLHSFLDKCDWKVGTIKSFLDASVNKEVVEEKIDGETPLMKVLTSENCSLDIIKLLLDYGADVNCIHIDYCSPLLVALYYSRHETIIEALLQKGAQTNSENHGRTPCGRTYICLALRNGASKGVVKLFLEAGCSPNACSIHYTSLHCASIHPKLGLKEGVIELLIEAGADMHHVGDQSPICLALQAGASVHDIKVLMREGSMLDSCLEHESPWFCATNRSCNMELKLDMVQLLLDEGVSVNVVNKDDWTPLQCALCDCKYQTKAIKMLLEKTDVSDVNNSTLLHLAVVNDHCKLKIVKLLIELGLKADQVDSCGETPLHRAVMSSCSNQSSVINLLLKKGSPVNAVNRGGFTPLKKAVDLEQECSIIQVLLSSGARIDDSLLKFVIRKYDQCNYIPDILKMLVKYSFLDNTFEVKNLIEGLKYSDALSGFAVQCAKEVSKMGTKEIGPSYTLHDFVTENYSPDMFAVVVSRGARNHHFNGLLRIMANTEFPIFFDVLSAKLGKMVLKTHLQEREVYTINYPQFPCVEKKSILDYDSLCSIMAYLSHADLLRMLIAYLFENDAVQGNSEDIVEPH